MFYRERVQSADEWRRDGDDIQRPIHKLLQQPYRTSRRWRVYICLSFTNGFQLPRVYRAIDHDPSLPTPFHELIISSSSIPSLRLLLVIPFLFAAPQDWPRAERREGGVTEDESMRSGSSLEYLSSSTSTRRMKLTKWRNVSQVEWQSCCMASLITLLLLYVRHETVNECFFRLLTYCT